MHVLDLAHRQFQAKGFREPHHCPFAGRIGAAVGQADKGGGTGDIDQKALVGLDQILQKGMGGSHQPLRIDPEGVQVLFQLHGLEFTAKHHSGVIDQRGDRAHFGVQLVAEFGDGGNLAHIQHIGMGFAAGGLDAVGHLAGSADAPGGDDDFGALFGKFLRHQGANAGTGAGDQNAMVVKTGHESSLG